jgi:hypothetical protein
MAKTVRGVVGIWSDDHQCVAAAHKTREAGYQKFDAITPFPVHGMEEAVGIKRSVIPWVTFVFGMTGGILGIFFQWYVHVYDWPINIGGKPFFSLPAFIPVTFETTILFAALSSVAACFILCKIPRVNPPVIDPALTSHKFALFVPEDDRGYDRAKIVKMFQDLGAEDVRDTEF